MIETIYYRYYVGPAYVGTTCWWRECDRLFIPDDVVVLAGAVVDGLALPPVELYHRTCFENRYGVVIDRLSLLSTHTRERIP